MMRFQNRQRGFGEDARIKITHRENYEATGAELLIKLTILMIGYDCRRDLAANCKLAKKNKKKHTKQYVAVH